MDECHVYCIRCNSEIQDDANNSKFVVQLPSEYEEDPKPPPFAKCPACGDLGLRKSTMSGDERHQMVMASLVELLGFSADGGPVD